MAELLSEDEYVEMDCEDFLEVVWGDREGWVDLPAKVNGYWVPFHAEWPADGVVSRRIDSSLRDREDLYYSVALFSERGRAIEHVLPALWLWADLDEVHPTEGARLGFLPTLAIESSPGRYQALWRLTRELKPRSLSRLNQGLSYALGADRGGWDLTQVLRIPGTRNFKYQGSPEVKLLWYKPELEYDPSKIWSRVKEAVPADELAGVLTVSLPRKPVSARAKALLRTPIENVVEGERSARLWELECLLAESGLTSDEIFDAVWPCSWNKWRGIASGKSRLRRDISKAIDHVRRKTAAKTKTDEVQEDAQKTEEKKGSGGDEPVYDLDGREVAPSELEPTSLPFIGYSSFMAMAMPEAKWLIRDIWTASSHGIIGGEPKTGKTTTALAVALSVASGRPFMGEYPVGVSGPVLFVQEENAPWMMQDRLRKLAKYYGLISDAGAHITRAGAGALGRFSVELDFPQDVPLRILNNYGFDLSVAEHREMLVGEIEAVGPRLLVLDPLYLILGGADENRTSELSSFLRWLIQLRYKYDLAVILVHHMRKQQQNGPVVRPGQRLLGSATFHGWVDSALYCFHEESSREGWIKTKIEREFRSMAPQRGLVMESSFRRPGDLGMDCVITAFDVVTELLRLVRGTPGIPLTTCCDRLGVGKGRVLSAGQKLGLRVQKGGQGRGKSTKLYPPRSKKDDRG